MPQPADPVERPDWLKGKFEWLRMTEDLPSASPLWAHDRCRRSCFRKDGSRLSPATLKHVCQVLGNAANEDGTRSFLGLRTLATKTSKHRSTVSAAVLHLETVGLIVAHVRGGQMGVPRYFATEYWLADPHIEIRPGVVDAEADARVYNWFTRAG